MCRARMQKRGRTAAGTQRWLCVSCNKSGVRERSDTRTRHLRARFVSWLTGTQELGAIAKDLDLCRDRLTDLFRPLWSLPAPRPPARIERVRVLIVDGVYLSGRTNAALVGRTVEQVCSWSFAERECLVAWRAFLAQFDHVDVIVMDGQKGLYEAVRSCFPAARIQRCLVHVERFVRTCISSRPNTLAGRELWRLTRSLWDVRTRDDARTWTTSFEAWCARHDAFLRERSRSPETGRWWYTHRKLRAARSHLRNALPHLFTFTEVSLVPRTTNHVEGGINARLKELVRRHRGLSPERKRVLAAHFLASKMLQKPPRNTT